MAPKTPPLIGREMYYQGSRKPTTVEIYFEDVRGQAVSHRTAGGKLTLGGVADLTPPQKFQLVNQEDRNQIVLHHGETRHIQIKPISDSEQAPSNSGEGQVEQKPAPKPGTSTPSAKPQPAPGIDQPQPTDPTPAVPNPQPAPNPPKPQPSKPTLPTAPTLQPQPSKPTLPTTTTPKPATPALPTQPVISHPASTNPAHQSLTTNLPAVTKPRPWAHHSAVDLWEAAPDTAADTATTPSQTTAHPHTSPATGYHHQAAHAANQPSAAPAKSPAKAPSAAKRLPQTNDRSNWPAVVVGSLLLSFTGIWRNRRIHQ